MAFRYRKTAQVKYNIKDYLEKQFVNAGFYQNVASGQLSVYGRRLDQLTRVNDTTYESYYDNWIYRTDASGISGYSPTIASGCSINGVWYDKGEAPYSPVVDYPNGRILFGSSLPVGATVTAPFAYNHVLLAFPDDTIVNLLFSTPKDNLQYTAHTYPSGIQRQLPVVIIDPQIRTHSPVQLGGGTKLWTQTVVLHILANNMTDLDNIMDVLDTQVRNVINAVDYNDAPQALTYQGDVATTYSPWTTLGNDSSYRWTYIYIDEVETRGVDNYFGYHRGRVDWTIKYYRSKDD